MKKPQKITAGDSFVRHYGGILGLFRKQHMLHVVHSVDDMTNKPKLWFKESNGLWFCPALDRDSEFWDDLERAHN